MRGILRQICFVLDFHTVLTLKRVAILDLIAKLDLVATLDVVPYFVNAGRCLHRLRVLQHLTIPSMR